jgi:hypothetical protein
MVTQGSRYRQNTNYTIFETKSTCLLDSFHLGRIVGTMVMRKSVRLSLMSENNASIPRVCRVNDVVGVIE